MTATQLAKQPPISELPPVLRDRLIRWTKITDPMELIAAVFDELDERAAIQASLQINTAVAIDMAARHARQAHSTFRAYTIDTGMLFEETLKYMADLNTFYGDVLSEGRIEVFRPSRQAVANLFSSESAGTPIYMRSQEGKKACCGVRKVETNLRALDTLDAYIVGLRKDESLERTTTTKRVSIHTYEVGSDPRQRAVLKVAPFVDTTLAQIIQYVIANDLPIHPLYGKGYPSFGCGPDCSVALKNADLLGDAALALNDPSLTNRQKGLYLLSRIAQLPLEQAHQVRDLTRWPWENPNCSKECGLHTHKDGSGI